MAERMVHVNGAMVTSTRAGINHTENEREKGFDTPGIRHDVHLN